MTARSSFSSGCKIAASHIHEPSTKAKAGFYEEDDSPGNTDMEFSCPKCSAELDAEAIIGF